MVRPAARFRPFLLVASLLLVVGCTGGENGVRRLPLEPEASLGILSVAPKASRLGWIGASAQLTAQVTGGSGVPAKGFTYTWRSLNEAVLTVDAAGRITSVAEGTAKVVATTLNLADTATITVARVPATIEVSSDSLLFIAVGATTTLSSTVRDGGGVELAGSTVSWTSSDSAVATVSQSGVVTSVGQGRADLTAKAGDVSKVVRVRVSVGASSVTVTPSGLSFDALGDSVQLVATVKDAAGGVLPGVPVTFIIKDSTVASISAGGLVRSKKVGTTQVIASADSLTRVVAVNVTQKVSAVSVTPDSTNLIPGATVTLTALAWDRNGHPIPSATMTWASSNTAVATVSSSGVVTAGSTEGTSKVTATSGGVTGSAYVTVLDVPVATVDLDPSSLSLTQGSSETLTATLRAADGTIMEGPVVTWTSDNAAVALVGSQGMVTAVGLGTTWIHATVQDTVAATDSASVTVTALVGAFDIEIRYVGTTPSAAQLAAFAAAEARWEEILVGDLPALPVNQTSLCGVAGADVNETVDDLIIFAQVDSIDGPGNILGQAGPCWVRVSNGLAAVGGMVFDEADLDDLEASGELVSVITHEMGHVLGLGSSTPWEDILVGKGTGDPYWPGPNAVARYDAAGGSATNKVPVANTGGEGTRDAHWREASMGAELMTGYLNSGSNPLSAITIAAFRDIGYDVDFTKADAYTVGPALRAPGRVFQLRELPLPPPVFVAPDGRIVPGFRLR